MSNNDNKEMVHECPPILGKGTFESVSTTQAVYYLSGEGKVSPERDFCVSNLADIKQDTNKLHVMKMVDNVGMRANINNEISEGCAERNNTGRTIKYVSEEIILRNNPIWVVKTDESIVDGHSGIYGSDLKDFIIQLYRDKILNENSQNVKTNEDIKCLAPS